MSKGKLELLSTVPGSRNLAPIIEQFASKPGGIIAVFSDSFKKAISTLIDENADVELLEFGALAHKLASFCGEMPKGVARSGQVQAAIATACEELPPESPFYRTAKFEGLHRSLLDTMHELAGYGFEPDVFDSLIPQATPRLSAKLESLSLIERDVAATLKESGKVLGRENLRMCLEAKPGIGTKLGRILVIATDPLAPSAIELMEWAAGHGARVTLVTYRHPANPQLFSRSLPSSLAEAEMKPVGESNQLLNGLFTDSEEQVTDLRCEIVSAPDPLAEAEWALRSCLQQHRETGMSYGNMALYARSLDSYAPLIEASARRLGIPIQLTRRAPLLTNSFARLTCEALQACVSRDVRKLLNIVRSSYAKLPRALVSEVEEALDEARLTREQQWQLAETWISQKEELAWLVKILDWRKKALSTTLPLDAWVGELRGLISLLPWDGQAATTERDVRAQFVLWQSISAIAAVRRKKGPAAISLSEFARKAIAVWEDSDVSVPSASHGVHVVRDSQQLVNIHFLWVLGMLEGSFPRRRSEDPILTDREREELSRLHSGPPLPTSRDKAESERDEFYLVSASASDRITFSYPETDEERDNVPAFYLEEIRRLAGIERAASMKRSDLAPPLQQCIADSDRRLRAAIEGEKTDSPINAFESPETRGLLPDPPQKLRPRELREALLCPFRRFAHQVLEVRPDRLQTRWHALTHLPTTAQLLMAESEDAAYRQLEAALESEIEKMFNQVPEWETKILRTGGHRQIKDWIEREFLARNAWPKSKIYLDRFFGQPGLRDDMSRDVSITGRVAATSRLGPYSVVHLLESSSPNLDQGGITRMTDPDTLYYGLHLMAAFEKGMASAVEVETMAGERVLMVLPRIPSVNLASRQQAGLKVIDLGSEGTDGTSEFYKEVKRCLRESVARIRAVEVFAIRGEHCSTCDYGELCRNSAEFGEEDSPFAAED